MEFFVMTSSTTGSSPVSPQGLTSGQSPAHRAVNRAKHGRSSSSAVNTSLFPAEVVDDDNRDKKRAIKRKAPWPAQNQREEKRRRLDDSTTGSSSVSPQVLTSEQSPAQRAKISSHLTTRGVNGAKHGRSSSSAVNTSWFPADVVNDDNTNKKRAIKRKAPWLAQNEHEQKRRRLDDESGARDCHCDNVPLTSTSPDVLPPRSPQPRISKEENKPLSGIQTTELAYRDNHLPKSLSEACLLTFMPSKVTLAIAKATYNWKQEIQWFQFPKDGRRNCGLKSVSQPGSDGRGQLDAHEKAQQAAELKLKRQQEKQALAKAVKKTKKQQVLNAAEKRQKKREEQKLLREQEKELRQREAFFLRSQQDESCKQHTMLLNAEKAQKKAEEKERLKKDKEDKKRQALIAAEERKKKREEQKLLKEQEKELRQREAFFLRCQQDEIRRQQRMLLKAEKAQKKAEEKERLKKDKEDKKRLREGGWKRSSVAQQLAEEDTSSMPKKTSNEFQEEKERRQPVRLPGRGRVGRRRLLL